MTPRKIAPRTQSAGAFPFVRCFLVKLRWLMKRAVAGALKPLAEAPNGAYAATADSAGSTAGLAHIAHEGDAASSVESLV